MSTTITEDQIAPVVAQEAEKEAPVITKDIQERVQQIIIEQNQVIKSRTDVVHGMWVARIAQQHLLMLGPGGTGKSFLVRDTVSHIEGAKHFEVALDETTDPGQVFGPPDIPAMVKEGKSRRVVTDMMPEATDAFVDEIFNGNSPVLHSLMPIMNERIFHNNGMPSSVPLRSLYAGTNKLNADSDLAAFFDRLHLRYQVDYLRSRTDKADMVSEAVARLSVLGRGTGTSLTGQKTIVTLAELDQAHAEALALEVPDGVMDLFLDLGEELAGEGIHVSDRRQVDGMVAVLANAWIRGHETVQAADLDILTAMWWTLLDHRDEARKIILKVASPGDHAAIDLTKELRKIEEVFRGGKERDEDADRMRRIGIEVVRDCDKLDTELASVIDKVEAAGANSEKLHELAARVFSLKQEVGSEVFGLDPAQIVNLRQA